MRSWVRSEFQTILKVEARRGLTVKVRERKIPEEKIRIVQEAKELLKKYRTLVLLDLANTPAVLVAYLRRALEGKAVVKLIKNTLLERAIDEAGIPNGEELKKYLTGQNLAIFTNMNPFELKLLLDKIEIPVRARPGMKLEYDIVVPPTKTNLKPGPIMSLFGRFRIPTQVKEGVIWIAKEVTIAKAGDTVTPELISLFEKLGIEPFLAKPKVKLAYDSGIIIPAEKLVVDIEATRNEILDAVTKALGLASEIALPVPMVLEQSVRKAVLRALALAGEAGFVTKEIAEHVIRYAMSKATTLAAVLASKSPDLAQVLQVSVAIAPAQPQAQQAAQAPAEEKKEEEEKKEGVSEEQLAEGLAALFG